MKFRVVMFAAMFAFGFVALDGSASDGSFLTQDAAACEYDGCEPCPDDLPPLKEGVKDPDAFKQWLTCPA